MKAMNLVAASKLQKAKQRLDAVRPMFREIQQIMDSVRDHEGAEQSVYFNGREEVKNAAYVIIASDRGLCGGYNINLSKEAMGFFNSNSLKHPQKKEIIITLGNKGWEYLRRRGRIALHKYEGPSVNVSYADAEKIGSLLYSMYTLGEIDEAYVVYTTFKSVLTHIPKVARILPIGSIESSKEAASADAYKKRMIFDPDIKGFMNYAVPLYLNTFMYGAMTEAYVCEEASRMTSMDSATKNASDIMDDLTLIYNRTRQSLITQEITEIVSGANALQ